MFERNLSSTVESGCFASFLVGYSAGNWRLDKKIGNRRILVFWKNSEILRHSIF
jgi:hypothetical protein